MSSVPLAPHHDESSETDEVKKGDVGVETLLDVLPVKLHSPSANPEKHQPGENQLGKPPAQASDQDLD